MGIDYMTEGSLDVKREAQGEINLNLLKERLERLMDMNEGSGRKFEVKGKLKELILSRYNKSDEEFFENVFTGDEEGRHEFDEGVEKGKVIINPERMILQGALDSKREQITDLELVRVYIESEVERMQGECEEYKRKIDYYEKQKESYPGEAEKKRKILKSIEEGIEELKKI